jgi:hypothetical protein
MAVLAQAPVPGDQQAPLLGPVVPLGAERGSALDLTLTGTNLAGPIDLWTSFPAKVSIPTDNKNGTDNNRLRVHVEVPSDAPLGFHWLRLATTRGLSNCRLFCLDDLPQILGVENNHSRSTAQSLPVPCVVVGRVDAEQSNFYRIRVKALQRVSFELLGRRLGSALDPQVTLYDARQGRAIPGAHANNSPGLQADARLTYNFKQDGECFVEVRDAIHRGGPDYWYRLRIGDFPCATTPIPMAARRGGQISVQFAGPNVEGVASVEVAIPTDPSITALSLAPRGMNGLYGWPVTLSLSDFEEMMEVEPNDDLSHANRLRVPCGVTGRFLRPGDVDCYQFRARKGQRIVIEAQTGEMNSPAEVYMALKDPQGRQVAASNPMAAPQLDFTAPAEGDYLLAVEHLLHWNGPAETYHLVLRPYEPDFSLTVGLDRFQVARGGIAIMDISANRRDFAGPIDVKVVGDPRLAGQVSLRASDPVDPKRPGVPLFLRAAADAPLGVGTISILGTAIVNGKSAVRYANLRALTSQNLSGLPNPPPGLDQQVGLTITEPSPLSLKFDISQAEVARAAEIPIRVSVVRGPGLTGAITLTPAYLPPHVGFTAAPIAKEQCGGLARLQPALDSPLGRFPISFTASCKFKDREYHSTAAPIPLEISLPFELQIEPPSARLSLNAKAILKVTAKRKGGYDGPINLVAAGLPAHVNAKSALIARGQSTARMELSADADAKVGSKGDVHILGTALGAANQQIPSPGFTVSVHK